MPDMIMNDLGCMAVMVLLPPLLQSMMRCGGSRGPILFDECTRINAIPIYGKSLPIPPPPDTNTTPAPKRATKRKVSSDSDDDEDDGVSSDEELYIFIKRRRDRRVMNPTDSTFEYDAAMAEVNNNDNTGIQGDNGDAEEEYDVLGDFAPISDSSMVLKGLRGGATPSALFEVFVCCPAFQIHHRAIRSMPFRTKSLVSRLTILKCDDLTFATDIACKICPKQFVIAETSMELHTIPPNVFQPTIRGHSYKPSHHLSQVDLSDSSNGITTMGEGCFANCSRLRTVDLEPFRHLSEIDIRFLERCSGIVSLDFTPLVNVTRLGAGFLSGCSSLTSVDLSPMVHLVEIGPSFLANCKELKEVDLRPLCNLHAIPSSFLSGCTGLVSIDLSPFGLTTPTPTVDDVVMLPTPNTLSAISPTTATSGGRGMVVVSRIGGGFLQECTGLAHVDLSPLSSVQAIGPNFLADCVGLESVDLAPLSQIKELPEGFLQRCSNIQSIDLSPIVAIEAVGASFLRECSSLIEIDLRPLHRIVRIERYFLQGCTSLTAVDFSHLTHIESVGNNFLANCCGLRGMVRLDVFARINEIYTGFMAGCSGLTQVDLSPFTNVTCIGASFLADCSKLEGTVDITAFKQVKRIDFGFMKGCKSIAHIDLRPLQDSVEVVGSRFLGGCKGLLSMDLTPIQNARRDTTV